MAEITINKVEIVIIKAVGKVLPVTGIWGVGVETTLVGTTVEMVVGMVVGLMVGVLA